MTREQLGACIALDEQQGLHPVTMPMGDDTPIPGVILYADTMHHRLLMVQPDGTVVDLLRVWMKAEDCIRNWGKGSTMPGFVGDFGRLTKLAKALNGKDPRK